MRMDEPEAAGPHASDLRPVASPEAPQGKLPRRPVGATPVLYRRLPFVLVAFCIAVVLGLKALTGLLERSEPQEGEGVQPPAWKVIGEGEVRFLGALKPVTLRQTYGAQERFRIETPAAAFENLFLETALKSFVRDALSGVRPGESLRILLRRTSHSASTGGGGEEPIVDWTISIVEEKRGAETWYALESHPLEARSTEDLKERAAREVARSAGFLFRGEWGG